MILNISSSSCENRAFDHYFGKLKGVRGFNDRSAPLLPNMKSQFYQPHKPDAIKQCTGLTCTNMDQGKKCLPGLPGSNNKTWTCCYLRWEEGNLTCPPTPPPASSCEGATTLQECSIQNQTCPSGTKGAGPNGNRCCGGWWMIMKRRLAHRRHRKLSICFLPCEFKCHKR